MESDQLTRIASVCPETVEAGHIKEFCKSIVSKSRYRKYVHNGDPVRMLYFDYCIVNPYKEYVISIGLVDGTIIADYVNSDECVTDEQAMYMIETLLQCFEIGNKDEENV